MVTTKEKGKTGDWAVRLWLHFYIAYTQRLLATSTQRNESLTNLVEKLRGEKSELLSVLRSVHEVDVNKADDL